MCSRSCAANDGRRLFVYASNRGHDSLAGFEFDLRTERLRPCTAFFPSGGSLPWTFDPLWGEGVVLVQNQGGLASAGSGYTEPLAQPGNIALFKHDRDSGALLPYTRPPLPSDGGGANLGAVAGLEIEHAMFVLSFEV